MRSETELRAALAQAQDLFTEAEIDYRQLRFLTDDELRAFMVEQASVEKASIRQAVEADRIYVVAGADIRRVHYWDCSSLREQIDRDRAWSFWLRGEIATMKVDGRNMLKFEASPQHRHQIPRLLADDYLHSYLTDRSYEAGSKQGVSP